MKKKFLIAISVLLPFTAMAQIKISELPVVTTTASGDKLIILPNGGATSSILYSSFLSELGTDLASSFAPTGAKYITQTADSTLSAEQALASLSTGLMFVTTTTGAITSVVPGTGVVTALGVNVGSAGAPVLFNGAGGTPSSITLTNGTGLPAAGVTGTAAVLGANTFTGAQINSTNGAASVSAAKLTGVPFAGTGTTSFPLLYINDAAATACSVLATGGTYLGVNGHGTANLIWASLDGAIRFSVDSAGSVVIQSTLQTGGVANLNEINLGSGWAYWVQGASGGIGLGSGHNIAWKSTTTNTGNTGDVGLSRIGAGVLGLGNGTATSIAGRLKLASGIYTATTITNLNASPTAGEVSYITDGDSSLAWGATAVNSGSGATKYLVWYNGTNWTVMGK